MKTTEETNVIREENMNKELDNNKLEQVHGMKQPRGPRDKCPFCDGKITLDTSRPYVDQVIYNCVNCGKIRYFTKVGTWIIG